MMPQKYVGPIKYLGGAIAGVLIFGLLIFPPLSEAVLSEGTLDSVLVSAIPFVAVFVSIILAFILLIFMVALRFNRQIPLRTYRPVEMTIIAGILAGVACLFQPWEITSYKFGFSLLLGSLLTFMLWSHVVPRGTKNMAGLKPFARQHQVIGALAGGLVLVVLMVVLVTSFQPQEPYGRTQREWDRRLRDEEKAQIKADAEDTFRSFTLPFFVFLSAFPSAGMFFIAREAAAIRKSE